jgi:hypothetical protein
MLEMQTDTINRNEHSELIRNSVQDRADWRDGVPDKTQPGKIYDLNFADLRKAIGQENLNRIRNTHVFRDGVQTDDKCDTLIQTLEDIGRLTDEDIADMDILPVTKEALTLIRDELVNSDGEYDQQKARAFEKIIMNYPPNRENYIDNTPDYGKWKGEVKVGFRVVGGELTLVKPPPITNMLLTTEDRNTKLKLVFTVDTVDENGKKKISTYNIIYDVANRAGEEENPKLYINDNAEPENLNGLTIVDYLTSNTLVSEDNMKERFQNVTTPGKLSGLNETERSFYLYINRLELVARIGFRRGDFVFIDNGKRCTYRYQQEYTDKNPYKLQLRSSTGAIIEENKEGWLYTVTIGDKTREVLIPRSNDPAKTRAENNDIPLICFGQVPDIVSVKLNPAPLFDETGHTWVVSNGNNQHALIDYYKQRSRTNPFWNEHKLFLGGN